MATLTLELVTPEGSVLSEPVEGVSLPTVDGEITVLAGHQPIVVPIQPGEITVHKKGGREYLATSGGWVEITHTLVRVLADTAEHAHSIDESRAKKAVEQAQKIKTEAVDTVQFAEAAAALERALARVKVAGRRRRG